ncbi:uncharacterized protein LOC107512257 [Rousettus aegyptiacus]|uniref:uncharacterized protein LOC107512257 n=1 Tax=Rousettus aegyptiacus TaxID=9407 RepID=UPI00168CD167|nr:uncharacterized protein LOC107512257 [Rousettus aegyptiacus]
MWGHWLWKLESQEENSVGSGLGTSVDPAGVSAFAIPQHCSVRALSHRCGQSRPGPRDGRTGDQWGLQLKRSVGPPPLRPQRLRSVPWRPAVCHQPQVLLEDLLSTRSRRGAQTACTSPRSPDATSAPLAASQDRCLRQAERPPGDAHNLHPQTLWLRRIARQTGTQAEGVGLLTAGLDGEGRPAPSARAQFSPGVRKRKRVQRQPGLESDGADEMGEV